MNELYGKFTKRARQTLSLAADVARNLQHQSIGSEHLLMGVLLEQKGVAARVLADLGMTPEAALNALQAFSPPGAANVGEPELGAEAQEVLKYAVEAAQQLEHDYIGTEHLLLGIARADESMATRVLALAGIAPEQVQEIALRFAYQKASASTKSSNPEIQFISTQPPQRVPGEGRQNIARLTTHVLDTAQGKPARNMQIELWALGAQGERTLLKRVRSNADGRTDEPLLVGRELRAGQYELVFDVGTYFAEQPVETSTPPFLSFVPLRFSITDAKAHYHVPLLVSPWAYSTYRGS